MSRFDDDIQPPVALIFDWHGTLVDTHDAMFSAMEEMLPQLEELGLVDQLLPEAECRTEDDARLVRYIRIYRRLHPRILAERRVSRTDIFNAIFGDNKAAKWIAHKAYNQAYRKYFGQVKPFQPGAYEYLSALKAMGIKLAVCTNRNREFLDQELTIVDEGRWQSMFDATVCADDVTEYKPDPEVILKALDELSVSGGKHIWYMGDSYVDMLTAHRAGVAGVFYNGAGWEPDRIGSWFTRRDAPAAVLDSFEDLMDLLALLERGAPTQFRAPPAEVRPKPFPPPERPEPRIEPDWHPAVVRLIRPAVILFDWHATLVDTLDAMYHAVDDMLPDFHKLGLMNRMVAPEDSKTPEDARLVAYVREFAKLHPKVKADRKISRTDIFEVLFGEDQEAKQVAHKAFNHHYRNHYGTVKAFEPRVREMLEGLRKLGIQVGVITNRDREFFEHELAAVEETGWTHLFDVNVCGDDTPLRKPHPDQLLLAVQKLDYPPDPSVWYVGDSTTDIIAAKRAGMTAVFFNGAQWDLPWLNRIFPGTHKHPDKPDVVVNDFSEFWALVLACEIGPP
ncbi:HAD family hydrolase [Marinobacter daepoensis]|uniref:phosphoglycolate phosphatase n=1 Tax=Marinobacter daepoensis TaxID=262077 RepID=A0ABS3BH72_9GAMM|nr:HAD-IA family hydrolase [Marinobacter daepoensis]MBN7770848.1 HAD-IA family hydrolase [Marinobacter daepoensis]MBY6078709.1 HAD family hydrolase [Marinobacter daepoensis]